MDVRPRAEEVVQLIPAHRVKARRGTSERGCLCDAFGHVSGGDFAKYERFEASSALGGVSCDDTRPRVYVTQAPTSHLGGDHDLRPKVQIIPSLPTTQTSAAGSLELRNGARKA